MITYGYPPYIECSSVGDKRFSALYAKPSSLGGKSIEEAYQAMKVFADGTTGLGWKSAKGRRAINMPQCQDAYVKWWREYVTEKNLLSVLQAASGLSDRFGKTGSICQAAVLWEIRNSGIIVKES